MDAALDAVVPLFRNRHAFLLTTHINPDGDGLGAEIALGGWLASQGKHVSIVNDSPTPRVYRFLDPDGHIATFNEIRDAPAIAAADVIVVLDTNHPNRLRAMEPHVLKSKAVKVCIDHHLEPAPFADHYVLDDDATSTGEIIYRILTQLHGNRLPQRVAQALYCAIMTDTGSYRYPRVDPEIFRMTAHLVECGADPVRIYHEVYEQWSAGRIQLLGFALESLTTDYGGALACITVTREMLRKTGTTEEDTDNFTTYPMSIGGARAGILFLELDNGVKISFRSRGEIPINELAKEFGGNGHKNAAGARLTGVTLDRATSAVRAAARKYLDADVYLPPPRTA